MRWPDRDSGATTGNLLTGGLTTVSLTAVTLATVVSFCRVFEGWSFVSDLVVVAVVGHTVSALGRMARLATALALTLSLVAVAFAVAWLHLPGTLWFGIPTADTLTLTGGQLADTWRQVGVAVTPVEYAAGFALTSLLSIGIAAVLADAIGFRTRARVEALVPTGIVFVAVSALGHDRLRAAVTALWFACALVYAATARSAAAASESGWVGRRLRAVRTWSMTGLAIALVVAPLAGVVGPRLPGADAEPLLEPRVRETREGGGGSLSPLVDIRGRLSDRSDAVLFSVRADRPAYWRMASLSEFDGSVWRIPAGELQGAGGQLGRPTPYGEPLVQQFRIERLDGNLVPVAATPTDLRSSDVDLYYARGSGTLVVADPGLANGDEFEIVSSTPQPPADVLASATSIVAAEDLFTDLPASWSPELTAIGRLVTGGESTPYGRALALQDWFRREFTYDLDVRFDTSGDTVAQFLRSRRGYCEQFAGAFAALARSLGMPARVAIGFTPGERGADGAYRVRSRHAHAWPEIWFDEIGWVSFEPTPGRGEPGAEDRTGVAPAQDDAPGEATTTIAPTTTTPGATGSVPAPTEPGDPSVVSPSPDVETTSGSPARWLLLSPLVVVLWCLVMPVAVRRRVAARDPDQRVVDDWNASVGAMRLAGVRVDPGATPREAASAIARQSGLDRHELLELATAATNVVFGTSPLDEERRSRLSLVGRHVRESACSVVPFGHKVRSRLDPRAAARLVRG